MRILLINQFYPPDTAATGQLLADLAAELTRAGHEVHVLCSSRAYGGGAVHRLDSSGHAAVSPQIHRLGGTGYGRSSLLGRLIDYASFYALALWKALWLPRMQVCCCLTTPPFIGLVGVLLQIVKRTRLILWTMDLYPEVAVAYGALGANSIVTRVLGRLSRLSYRHARLIVSLGECMTRRLIAAGAPADRIVTVHNWVPGEAVNSSPPGPSPLEREWGLDREVVVMYSGNLGLGHDLVTALKAFALVRREFAEANRLPAARLVLVGQGKMREELERLAATLGVSEVLFKPPVPLERLDESLAMGDIHIVAQKPGTQGIIVPSKIYGVLAAGRPTVFIGPSDCELAEILRSSGAGIVLAPGDCEGVAGAMRRLLADEQLRREMGRNARAYYETYFGRDRSVSRIVQRINDIRPTGMPLP